MRYIDYYRYTLLFCTDIHEKQHNNCLILIEQGSHSTTARYSADGSGGDVAGHCVCESVIYMYASAAVAEEQSDRTRGSR